MQYKLQNNAAEQCSRFVWVRQAGEVGVAGHWVESSLTVELTGTPSGGWMEKQYMGVHM